MHGRLRKQSSTAPPWLWWLLALLCGFAVWRLVQEGGPGPGLQPSKLSSTEFSGVRSVPQESPFKLVDGAQKQSMPGKLLGSFGLSAQGPLDEFVTSAQTQTVLAKADSQHVTDTEAEPGSSQIQFEKPTDSAGNDAGGVDAAELADDLAEGGPSALEGLCNDVHPNADDPNMLHVVFASDLSQVEGVQASVTSVVTSAMSPDLLTVHIMVRAKWAQDFKKAFGLMPECQGAVTVTGVLIRVHAVEVQLIERAVAKVSASVKKERGAIDTLENFARFYMHLVLERASIVIYLDADIIVQADLGRLRQELVDSGKTVGFVAREQKVLMEKFLRKPKKCDMKRPDSPRNLTANWNALMKKPAYNVGVFAVNLLRWKTTGAVERVEQFVSQHNACGGALWVGGSQPPLLLAFHHRLNGAERDFIVFDAAWNAGDLGWREKMNVDKLAKKFVLHWNGNKKPWRADGLYKDLWKPHRERFSSLLQPFESGDASTPGAAGASGAESSSPGHASGKEDLAKAPSGRRRRRSTTTLSPEEMAAFAACPYVELISEWTEGDGLPCVMGKTYGCGADNRSMWVRSGCSGAFVVRGAVTSCTSASKSKAVECKSGLMPVRKGGPCGLMILTTYFTTKKDWQRGKYAKARFDKIQKLYSSALRHALRITVVYDDLPQEMLFQYSTDFFRFHRVNLSDFDLRYGVNDVRYFFFQRLVKAHSDWTSVFIVDAFDVRIGMDMCQSIKPDVLYLGVELDKLKNHPWMKARFTKMGGKYKQWYQSRVDNKMKILNCGLTGGRRDIMLKLFRRMTEVIADPELAPNKKGDDVNLNMAALNYIVYNEFGHQFAGGPPVHSLYKRFQNKRKDVWFIHK